MIIRNIKIKHGDFSNSSNLIFKLSDTNSSLFIQTGVCNFALEDKLESPSFREECHDLSLEAHFECRAKLESISD